MLGWTVNDSLFLAVKDILDWVNVFFILYMIGYSTFLFLAVVIGSSDLYKKRQQENHQPYNKTSLFHASTAFTLTKG